MQVVVLADGVAGSRAELDRAWPGWLESDAPVIAADGGARHADGLGLRIDRWVGDGDSLGEDGIAALIAAGVPVDRAAPDKDESDTELAVRAALARQPASIVLLGALGGPRLDHALANFTLLSMPELVGIDVRLVAPDARVRLLRGGDDVGRHGIVELDGRVDDLVTLLPVGGDAEGLTTEGLAYPLVDEPLLEGHTRGLSNRRSAPVARVRLRRGRVLVIETPATL